MTEIDLHGFKHDEVDDKLANLLILHYNMGNFPIRIITGKSEKMVILVTSWVRTGDPQGSTRPLGRSNRSL